MNDVILKGTIRDIQPSHIIDGVEYCKSNLIVKNLYTGKDDIITVKFKKFANRYHDGDYAEIYGNLRSYSQRETDGKNKVDVYVFTYQDIITEEIEGTNLVKLDGRVCKIDPIRTTNSGKQTVHFTLANNIISDVSSKKVNSYIPCVAWGKLATSMGNIRVNDKLQVEGELHSREYKKYLDNEEIEIRVAHELVIKSYTRIIED